MKIGNKLKKQFVICVVVYVFSLLINLVYALPDFAVVETNNKKVTTVESSIQTNAPTFNFKSGAHILMEASTGKIIYANNETETLYPASVTKIMTMLLIMEKIDSGALKYTDTVTCTKQASLMGGSQVWFKEGEVLTIDEALKCIAVVSANDVSYAMAELVGGSHDNFVSMMNDKAKELGMDYTKFMNAHGIDEEGHYTCAKDIALMSRELITKHPDILKYTTIWQDSIRNGTFTLSSTNKLLKTYSGLTGLKTGSTSQAMYNLSATATREGLTLIAVVMKAPSGDIRGQEITTLLNYGFSNYSVLEMCKEAEVVDKIKINKNISEEAEVVTKECKSLLMLKGEKREYTKQINIKEKLIAPLELNEVIGEVKWIDEEGQIVCKTELVVNKKIGRSKIDEYISRILQKFTRFEK
ncbi:MAG: D-alanyl-D-alanine carboxypeptidase [Clostridia bacterium]|nr:D-alanyl-D-alanine carboxypeptidase [Clostridia bacterium]